MNVIILAAGKGSRFNNTNHSSPIPKCLAKVKNNQTILELNLKNINSFNRIMEIDIVVGYKYDLLIKHLESCNLLKSNINIKYNYEYDKTVIFSILEAFNDIKNNVNSILLLNGDTYFHKNIINNALEIYQNDIDGITLFGYHTKKFYSDDMLINSSGGQLLNVGKNLDNSNGVSSGAILMTNRGLEKYISFIHSKPIDQLNTHHGILQLIINSGYKIDFIDIGGRDWLEIDNQDDLDKAKKYFVRNK